MISERKDWNDGADTFVVTANGPSEDCPNGCEFTNHPAMYTAGMTRIFVPESKEQLREIIAHLQSFLDA